MSSQADIQSLLQTLGGVHTAGQASAPSAVNNGNPNTVYNTRNAYQNYNPYVSGAPVFDPSTLPAFAANVGNPWQAPSRDSIMDVLPRWGTMPQGGPLPPGTPGGGGTPPPVTPPRPGPGTGGPNGPITGGGRDNEPKLPNPTRNNLGGPDGGGRPGMRVDGGYTGTGNGAFVGGGRAGGGNSGGSSAKGSDFFSGAEGIWGKSPGAARKLGFNQDGSMDWQQGIDLISELVPGLTGVDLWNSQTNSWNQDLMLKILANGVTGIPLIGDLLQSIISNNGAKKLEDDDPSNDDDWSARMLYNRAMNDIQGGLNKSQSEMRNAIAREMNKDMNGILGGIQSGRTDYTRQIYDRAIRGSGSATSGPMETVEIGGGGKGGDGKGGGQGNTGTSGAASGASAIKSRRGSTSTKKT